MLFSCEESNQDLYRKSTEELVSLKSQLNTQLCEFSIKKQNLDKERRIVTKKIEEIEKNIKLIFKEIKRREDIEEAKNIIGEDIKKMEGFELLSEDELSIITTKMDKNDYRKYGNYPRYLDLERICKEVINMKKKYPKWTLSELSRGGQYDTLPPHTFYKYEYKDEYGCHFNFGGIQVLTP